MKNLKSLFILIFLGLVMFTLIGCTSNIELSFDQVTYILKVGQEYDLMPEVKNEDDIKYTLTYSSENPATATYIDGVVKAIAVGEVTVKVALKDDDKVFAETVIKVVEVPKFTVTFNSDGGTGIDPVQVVEKEKVAKPKDPTKTGYTFVNWYSNEGKTIPYNFNAPVTAALTLYAKFEINQYTVTFNTDGGTNIDAVKVNHGNRVYRPASPTKDNSQFLGWFTAPGEGAVEYNFNTLVVNDITIYAHWELNSYDVIFNSNGGSTVDKQFITYGNKAQKPNDPTKLGFEFVGWFKDSAKTLTFDFDTDVINETTVVYGKWKLVELAGKLDTRAGIISGIDLTFKPKDGVTPKTQVLGYFNDGYNGTNAEKSIFLYEGDHQIFGGDAAGKEVAWWSYKVALTQIAPKTFIVEKNIGNEKDVPQGVYDYILVGLWKVNLYPGFNFVQGLTAGEVLVIDGVDFTAAGSAVEGVITKYGANDIDNYYPLTVKPGTVLPIPTKTGFVFAGWYDNANFAGNSITTITEDTSSSMFYAKWTDAERFTVSFVTDVVDLNIYPVLRLSGQKVKTPTLAREGYTLVGWFTDETRTTVFDFNTAITANITLYAKFEAVQVE